MFQEIDGTNNRTILDTIHDISVLKTWPPGWNGYDAIAPYSRAVDDAINWITTFYQQISNLHLNWLKPNVTASADGEIVLEWRQGPKNLTIYVGIQDIAYVKDWGIDLGNEMEDGYITSPDISINLWRWLVS